jgi:hypothetical protein
VRAGLEKEAVEQVTVTIPASLNNQITDKAQALGTSGDVVISVLLKEGLAIQSQREQKISELHDAILSTKDEAESRAATDRLGGTIFGK